jgi:hypothetical protein
MMTAFHDKINTTPSLYFLLGWLWAKAFGPTELSLRLFSSLGIIAAFVVVWIVLRRTYDFWPASIGTLGAFGVSKIVLMQNAEARMYGLYLALSALALLQYDSINRKKNWSWAMLLSIFLVNAAIVHTHLFGLFYSGGIALALIIRDIYFRDFRPKIYVSVALSWLTIILYVPAFLVQVDAGNPRSWIAVPGFEDLVSTLMLSPSSLLSLILLYLILVSGLQYISTASDPQSPLAPERSPQNQGAEISLLIFAGIFMLIPVFVWVVSRTIKPIFVDRYLAPSLLSWSILIAFLSSRILMAPRSGVKSRDEKNIVVRMCFFLANPNRPVLIAALSAFLLVSPIVFARALPKQPLPGSNDSAYGYTDVPVVTQFSHDFVRRLHYSPERSRYFFILDWQAAVDDESGLFAPQEYKHMEALKRNYPELFQNNIIQSEEFLDAYSQFLVLDYKYYEEGCESGDGSQVFHSLERTPSQAFHCPKWLEKRILSDPRYQVTPLGDVEDRTLLFVEKLEE